MQIANDAGNVRIGEQNLRPKIMGSPWRTGRMILKEANRNFVARNATNTAIQIKWPDVDG